MGNKHKEYIMSGSFDSIPEDANLINFEPTKTSELTTNCDEKRDTCIEYNTGEMADETIKALHLPETFQVPEELREAMMVTSNKS